MIRFSLLISIYKGNNILDITKLFNSIKSQNFQPSKIIIVFDGEVHVDIKNFLSKQKNIEYIQNKKNLGLGISLRKGLVRCSSNFIIRCDADDINLTSRFKILVKKMIYFDIVGSQITEQSKNRTYFLKKIPENTRQIYRTLGFRNCINHPTVGFKKKSILKIGSYESVLFFEDYYLWLKARKKLLKFYNIQFPYIKSSIDEKFYSRRSGRKYFSYYLKFIQKSYKNNLISLFELMINFATHLPLLLDSKSISLIYKFILRKKVF